VSDAETAARLTEALLAAAGSGASLVSVEVVVLARREIARVETQLTRKTKTLAFLAAEAYAADGVRIATAASVHKTG
jgi:hypothetical protein